MPQHSWLWLLRLRGTLILDCVTFRDLEDAWIGFRTIKVGNFSRTSPRARIFVHRE